MAGSQIFMIFGYGISVEDIQRVYMFDIPMQEKEMMFFDIIIFALQVHRNS